MTSKKANCRSGCGRSSPVRAFFFQAGVVLAGLFALYLLLDLLRGAYTNWLWFSHLGLRSVYSTVLFTRVWLFIAGLVVSGGALWLSYYAAFRYAWGRERLQVLPCDDPVDTALAHRGLRGDGRLHRVHVRVQLVEPVRQLPAVHERCGLRHRGPAVPQRRRLLHVHPARAPHHPGMADGPCPRHPRHDGGPLHAHLQREGDKPNHRHGRTHAAGAHRRMAHGDHRVRALPRPLRDALLTRGCGDRHGLHRRQRATARAARAHRHRAALCRHHVVRHPRGEPAAVAPPYLRSVRTVGSSRA